MISGKSDLDIERVDDRGVLMVYTSPTYDKTGRKPVIGAEYTDGNSYMNTSGFRDVVTQEDFEGGMEEAIRSADPPVAELLHPKTDASVLEELEKEGDRERYVIRRYSTFKGPNQDLIDYAEESDFFITVNPDGLDSLANYKGETHDLLHLEGVPVVPTLEIGKAVDRGESYALKRIGETGEGYLIKSPTSSKGRHQYRAKDWDEVIEKVDENNLENMKNSYLLQPFIPHEKDHRWMTYGGDVRAGMVRRTGDTYQTNVSSSLDTEMDTLEALHENRIAPLEPSSEEDARVAEAAVSALADEFADPELERPNIITSADVMVVEREDIEGLPEPYLEDIDSYGGDETAYLVTEFEPFPGKMFDHMHMWEGPEYGVPALQEAVFLEEMAGNDPGEPEEIAGNVDDRIWNRVRANFRSKEHIAASRMKEDMAKTQEEMLEETDNEKQAAGAGPRP